MFGAIKFGVLSPKSSRFQWGVETEVDRPVCISFCLVINILIKLPYIFYESLLEVYALDCINDETFDNPRTVDLH